MAGKIINLSEIIMSIQQENYVTEEVTQKAERSMESLELNKLFEALSKAQMDMEVAKTDSTNPYFKSKYADLRSIVDASRPFLAKNGLCVIQRTIPESDGASSLYTRLGHLSGQWMESLMPIRPPKSDIQTLGSYLTYLRRYSYASMVGVVSGDEDDDGECAMHPSRSGKKAESGTISQAQHHILAEELRGETGTLEKIFKAFSISKLSDLPGKKYTQCIERVREIKRMKSEGDECNR